MSVWLDRNAFKQGKKEKPPFVKSESPERVTEDDDKKIPGELLCVICNSLLTDAVVIPCCGNSYCDDCKSRCFSTSHFHSSIWDIVHLCLHMCILKKCGLHPSVYPLVSRVRWDWPAMWLSNHRPSVLWRCWLGHLTSKIVSVMTYNVSSGTLNPTVPILYIYRFIFQHIVYD